MFWNFKLLWSWVFMVKSQKGQATVELALSITVFVFLLFAVIDFGRFFHTYLTLDHTSREAARSASVGKSDSDIKLVIDKVSSSLNTDEILVNISPAKTSRTKGSYVTVHLEYPFSFSVPIFKEILPENVIVKADTVMRVE